MTRDGVAETLLVAVFIEGVSKCLLLGELTYLEIVDVHPTDPAENLIRPLGFFMGWDDVPFMVFTVNCICLGEGVFFRHGFCVLQLVDQSTFRNHRVRYSEYL